MINNDKIFSSENYNNTDIVFKNDTIGTKSTLNDINSVSNSLPKNEFRFIGNIKKFDKRYIMCELAYSNSNCIGFTLFTKIDKLNDDGEELYPKSLKDIKCPIPNVYIAIKPEGRGKHLSKELINKSIPYLKQMGYNKICWSAWFENIASRNAAISCGFKEVGISKYPDEKDGSHIFIKEI